MLLSLRSSSRNLGFLAKAAASRDPGSGAGSVTQPKSDEAPSEPQARPGDGVSGRVRELALYGEEIAAIAAYREETGAGLREAKRVVRALKE